MLPSKVSKAHAFVKYPKMVAEWGEFCSCPGHFFFYLIYVNTKSRHITLSRAVLLASHSFAEFASWYTVTLCPTLLLPFPYITDFIDKTKINEGRSMLILTLTKMICLNAAAWTPGTACLVSEF